MNIKLPRKLAISLLKDGEQDGPGWIRMTSDSLIFCLKGLPCII